MVYVDEHQIYKIYNLFKDNKSNLVSFLVLFSREFDQIVNKSTLR